MTPITYLFIGAVSTPIMLHLYQNYLGDLSIYKLSTREYIVLASIFLWPVAALVLAEMLIFLGVRKLEKWIRNLINLN